MEWQLTQEQWNNVREQIEHLVFHREENGVVFVRCEKNLRYFADVRAVIQDSDKKNIFDFSLF